MKLTNMGLNYLTLEPEPDSDMVVIEHPVMPELDDDDWDSDEFDEYEFCGPRSADKPMPKKPCLYKSTGGAHDDENKKCLAPATREKSVRWVLRDVSRCEKTDRPVFRAKSSAPTRDYHGKMCKALHEKENLMFGAMVEREGRSMRAAGK